jgi:hypothetical protein
VSITPEKFLTDWIDNNGVKLEGATPSMLVDALRGHLVTQLPKFDESLYGEGTCCTGIEDLDI